jgi:hypothetical protein
VGHYDTPSDLPILLPNSYQFQSGFSKGMQSNVWIFKVQNGEYGGADEPQKSQNFVRPSKQALKWCPTSQ